MEYLFLIWSKDAIYGMWSGDYVACTNEKAGSFIIFIDNNFAI